MPISPVTIEGLRDMLIDAGALGAAAEPPVVLVDLDRADSDAGPILHSGVPLVVVGLTGSDEPGSHPLVECCDVALHHADEASRSAIHETVARSRRAAVALCVLLRGAGARPLDDGLLLESATYSALQAGPEFAAWRAGRQRRQRSTETAGPVVLERRGGRLDIVLSRPHVRNALDTAMRDELVSALRLVSLDDSVTEVHLRGDGSAFCSGGDLDEFGSFGDPASAHIVRLQQSVGRALAAVAPRVTAHLHGSCMGSGIEIPAFAHRVIAAPDTSVGLPELGLGLIPGAGGTVSIPDRIGRHLTARLALTGERIDATTALRWGLVDEIEPHR